MKPGASRARYVNASTHSWGVGPVQLDVDMARTQGWSEAAIERTCDKLTTISRREGSIAHRNGPVPTCRCVKCVPPGGSR